MGEIPHGCSQSHHLGFEASFVRQPVVRAVCFGVVPDVCSMGQLHQNSECRGVRINARLLVKQVHSYTAVGWQRSTAVPRPYFVCPPCEIVIFEESRIHRACLGPQGVDQAQGRHVSLWWYSSNTQRNRIPGTRYSSIVSLYAAVLPTLGRAKVKRLVAAFTGDNKKEFIQLDPQK